MLRTPALPVIGAAVTHAEDTWMKDGELRTAKETRTETKDKAGDGAKPGAEGSTRPAVISSTTLYGKLEFEAINRRPAVPPRK